MSMIRKWPGRWNDGKTAQSHTVEIQLLEDKLKFTATDTKSPMPAFWPYDKIHSATPVKQKSDHVLLTSEQSPGQRLFIDETEFAKQILKFAPNITATKHTWSLLKWPLGMAVSMVLFWVLTYFNVISPAKYVANLLPENTRISLGQGIISTIQKKNKVCTEPDGTAALKKLVGRLKHGIQSKTSFNIKVVDLNFENAFAAPGDQIVMSGKLIRNAKSADEVAGVLAHEMGHSLKLHPETNIVRALGILAAMQLFTAGEAGAFGEIAFFLVQSGYSRTAENEADVYADNILKTANIDSRPLAGFFDRIITQREKKQLEEKQKNQKEEKQNNKTSNTNTSNKGTPTGENSVKTSSTPDKTTGKSILEWVSSHPPTNKRIEFFNKSRITTTPEILSNIEWKALQNICHKEEKQKDEAPKQKKESAPSTKHTID